MDEHVSVSTVVPARHVSAMKEVDALLASADLDRDADVELFALARLDGRLIGCMGLAGDIVKCVAVDESLRGLNVLGSLMLEIRYQALDRGHPHLMIYTKPTYAPQFISLGFRALAEVPDLIVLMEDDPNGLHRYVEDLADKRRDGERIAGIVMNANPFTRGHQYLVRTAAADCDVVHVFVVGEDSSEFTYADRFRLVSEGIAALPEVARVVIHPGSRYIISRSTFPQYFLKDAADIARAFTGIDLQLFRNHIAVALGIRHRFVGTEPASAITDRYNTEMLYWLQEAPSSAPPIEVHIIERTGTEAESFISASKVRALVAEGRLEELQALVPPTTFDFLAHNSSRNTSTTAQPSGLGTESGG